LLKLTPTPCHRRQKNIDSALLKLNEILHRHTQLHYSEISKRHVAEQIDRLYWNDADPARYSNFAGGRGRREVLERGTDYATPSNIAGLPSRWPDAEDDSRRRSEYAAKVERLKELDSQREELKSRVSAYRALHSVLVSNLVGSGEGDAAEVMQPNLVARGGELERELERMKMLLVRVRGRVEGLPPQADAERREGDEESKDEDKDLGKTADALF
jgi:hypothetical protein